MQNQQDGACFRSTDFTQMRHEPLHLLEVELPVLEALLVHADIGAVDNCVEGAVFLAPCHKSEEGECMSCKCQAPAMPTSQETHSSKS